MSSPPADRRQRLQQLVENSEYVGVRPKRVTEQRTINPADPKIKQDIIRMILQYLQEEGYAASFVTIQDETNVKLAEQRSQRAQLKRMRKAILDGDWVEVEKMCSKASLPNYKAFLYAAHRAQYLELIEGGESQKAFTHLTKRLKPLESVAPSPSDFRDLCYLLTCKSVQEVVRDWEGAVPARERLVEQYNSMLDLEAAEGGGTPLPEQRLLRLLQQAVAYQMEFSHYHPRAAATQVSTLLEDYACPLLPNAQDSLLPGDAGVKCLEWIVRRERSLTQEQITQPTTDAALDAPSVLPSTTVAAPTLPLPRAGHGSSRACVPVVPSRARSRCSPPAAMTTSSGCGTCRRGRASPHSTRTRRACGRSPRCRRGTASRLRRPTAPCACGTRRRCSATQRRWQAASPSACHRGSCCVRTRAMCTRAAFTRPTSNCSCLLVTTRRCGCATWRRAPRCAQCTGTCDRKPCDDPRRRWPARPSSLKREVADMCVHAACQCERRDLQCHRQSDRLGQQGRSDSILGRAFGPLPQDARAASR